ncbi:MAG: hypothetical protein HY716_02655 [Planctomycetes bacterium]|nr:hypothetical protein [Planctomycetota bacterium]
MRRYTQAVAMTLMAFAIRSSVFAQDVNSPVLGEPLPSLLRTEPENISQQPVHLNSISLVIGGKSLSGLDWTPAEDHGEMGIMGVFRPHDWDVDLVSAILFSAGDGKDFDPSVGSFKAEVATLEVQLGVRHTWHASDVVRPFLGGGLLVGSVSADIDFQDLGVSDSDDDGALGFWFHGGVDFHPAPQFSVGFLIGLSSMRVKLFDLEDSVDAGGVRFSLSLGFHW